MAQTDRWHQYISKDAMPIPYGFGDFKRSEVAHIKVPRKKSTREKKIEKYKLNGRYKR